MTRRCLAVLVLGALARAAHGEPTSEPTSEQERAFVHGTELFDRQEWAAARAEYLRSYAIEPRPYALLNIASTYRHENDIVNERRYYVRYLAEAGPDAKYAQLARERIAAIDATAAPAAAYPRAAIARPLVLPQLTTALAGGLGFAPLAETEAASGASTARGYTAVTRIGASFGAAPRLEVRGELALDVGSAARSLGFGAVSYGALDGDLALALRGTVGVAFAGPAIYDLRFAAQVRWRIGEQLAVISDEDHVVVTLDTAPRRVYLRAPIGLGYQLTDAVYATASTRLFDLEVAPQHVRSVLAGDRFGTLGLVVVPRDALDVVARVELVPEGFGGTVFVRWRI